MNELSKIFIKNFSDAKAKSQNIVKGEKYRFTILSPRLIRLEYNKNGKFNDNPTSQVISRNFEPTKYNVTETNLLIEIKTEYFTLVYAKNEPFKKGKISGPSTLKVTLNGTEKQWYYNHPEAENFKAYSYSLENLGKNFHLKNGLYSADGFATIDDSNTLVLDENGYYNPRETSIDIYLFMYKKDFGLALHDYFMLTGFPSLIPRQALGVWWYKNEKYNTNEIASVINKFTENNIDISVFLLGDKWNKKDSPFILDESIIYEKEKLISFLHQKNIKFGLTIDPSKEITTKDIEYPNISKYINSSHIKFTPLDNQRLELYLNIYQNKLKYLGIDFFNIDYNNEKDLNTLWMLEHYHYASSGEEKERLILSRNSGIATHRYPVTYTGKTKISWETLSVLPFYTLINANIGVSFVAHAFGGFSDGVETKELYLRYIQLATFSPIFLLASEGGKYYKKEPWKWNSIILSVIQKYMILRNKLIPFLYSVSYVYHKTGENIIKPLYYSEPKLHDEPMFRNEYFLGNEFLICPITKKKNLVMNRVVQKLYIPDGVWYDYFTGKKYLGHKYYTSFYKDEDYPVFCKAGSIIPMSLESNAQIPKKLEIEIFPGENNSYTLYEDTKNSYLITEITYKYDKNKYNLIIKPKEGNANIIDKRSYRFRFRNTIMTSLISILCNETNINFNSYNMKNDLMIEISELSLASSIEIVIEGNNLESSIERVINEEIASILDDLEISTSLKEKIDEIIFSNLPLKKKRIGIRKLKKMHLEPKFIDMFINLLSYVNL